MRLTQPDLSYAGDERPDPDGTSRTFATRNRCRHANLYKPSMPFETLNGSR